MNRRRPLIAAAAATAAIMVIAACSSSKKKTEGTGTNPAPSTSTSSSAGGTGPAIINGGYTTKGGTVNLLQQADFDHLDPVQNYVTNSGDVGKLIYRTLTVIKDTPGETPSIQPDLAESLGVASDGGKTWTYKIKHGLKFQDGSPITAKDIKYNIERQFAQDIYKDGATYPTDTLVNSNNYKGPYKDPNKDLTSVQTPDDYTIVFHFTGAQPDSDWMWSLFYSAPVPKAKDTKQDYDHEVVSSGPYMIQKYTPDKQLILVRNPNWDPATDPNRPALPDKFVITMNIAPETISQRLIANQGDDQTALSIDNSSDLQAGDLAKLRQPDVKSRFVNGAGPCVFYLYLNELKIKDADVRHAIALAINRQAVITAMNGQLFGSIPSSFMPSNVRGFVPANLGLKDTGDTAAAQALLQGKDFPDEGLLPVTAYRPGPGRDGHGRLVLGLADAGLGCPADPWCGQLDEDLEHEQLLQVLRRDDREADLRSGGLHGRPGDARQAVRGPGEPDPDHELAADSGSGEPQPDAGRVEDPQRGCLVDLEPAGSEHDRRLTVRNASPSVNGNE